MSIKYHQWGTGDEYGAKLELTDNWNPNADYGNEYVSVYFVLIHHCMMIVSMTSNQMKTVKNGTQRPAN